MDKAKQERDSDASRLVPSDSTNSWHDPLKPGDMTDHAWLGLLLNKQVGAIWVSDIPRLAACFTLTEVSDPHDVKPSGVEDAASELGWYPRTVNSLRLGRIHSWYIEIYMLDQHPTYGNLLKANESRLFNDYVAWRQQNRLVPFHPKKRVRIINGGVMSPTAHVRHPRLDTPTREHLEVTTLHGIAQLATNTPAPKVPVLPGTVDWQKVARPIFHGMLDTHGTLAKPVSHRDMVRAVMPRTGEAVSVVEIRDRVRQRYGDAAPRDHAIGMAVLHLCNAGALQRESRGVYAATALLWQPPKPSGPKAKGEVTKK